MGHKKSRPGKGKAAQPDPFTNWKFPGGVKTSYAWMAGSPEWYECHEHNDNDPEQFGTKVCLHWATDGELVCPRCRPFGPPTTIAYVPLYREIDTKPMFAICHESVADVLDGLVYGDYVYVGRVEEKSSIFVKLADTQKPWKSVLPIRQAARELLPTLLKLWGYPLYDRWLMERGIGRAASVENPPQIGEQTLSVPPPSTRAEALATDAHRNAKIFGGTADEVVNRLKAHAARAERNGKHDAASGGGE